MSTKRLFSLSFILFLVVTVVFTIRAAAAKTTIPRTGVDSLAIQEAERLDRVHEADAARWNAMAEHYFAKQAQEAARLQRVHDADAARWNAMAEYYFAKQTQEAERLQRVHDADGARWNAMAEHYFAKQTQEAPGNP